MRRRAPRPGIVEGTIVEEDARAEEAFRLRLKAGDPEAWRTLSDKYSPVLLRVANSILPRHADPEDAVGETWHRAWKSAKRYDPAYLPYVWLAKICTNECLRRLGRSRLRKVASDLKRAAAKAPRTEDAESANAVLQRALRKLSRRERQVVLLRQAWELSYAEVAEILRMTEAGLRTTLARAFARLRTSPEVREKYELMLQEGHD